MSAKLKPSRFAEPLPRNNTAASYGDNMQARDWLEQIKKDLKPVERGSAQCVRAEYIVRKSSRCPMIWLSLMSAASPSNDFR